METLGAYILSVTAAAILCAAIIKLGGKGSHGPLLKLMCGIVLTTVILKPIATVAPINLTRYLKQLDADAAGAVEAGIQYSETQLRRRISSELESYILDKAGELGMVIHVELTLDDQQPIPAAVTITGAASPYAKAAMTEILTTELGIPIEGQVWR